MLTAAVKKFIQTKIQRRSLHVLCFGYLSPTQITILRLYHSIPWFPHLGIWIHWISKSIAWHLRSRISPPGHLSLQA